MADAAEGEFLPILADSRGPTDQNTTPGADAIHDNNKNNNNNNIDPTEQIKEAITSGNLAAVEKVIDAHPDVLDTVTEYGCTLPGDDDKIRGITALMTAASLSNREVVQLLLEKGPSGVPGAEDKIIKAFFFAIRSDKIENARLLLQEGGTGILDTPIENDEVPLLLAAGIGSAIAMDLLLDHGANIKTRNEYDDTAIHIASKNGHLDVVEIICKAGGTEILEIRGEFGFTPLLAAAAKGRTEIVRFLIDKGASVIALGDGENTALHLAVKGKSLETARLLLKHDPGLLNVHDSEGKSALLIAAGQDDSDLTQFLLQQGANISAQDSQKNTALHIALKKERTEIVQLLLKELTKQPDLLELRNENEETILLLAAQHGNLEIIDALLDKGADVRALDYQENTALHLALEVEKIDIARRLLDEFEKHSGLLELRNKYEETVLHVAARTGDVEIVQSLLNKNADIEAEDLYAYTALLNATISRNNSVMKCLLDAGADRIKRTIIGRSLLHVACVDGSVEMVDLLLDSPTNLLKIAIAAKDDYGYTPMEATITRTRSRNKASIISQLLESKVYFPESPAQDEVYIAPESETRRLSQSLLDWVAELPTKNINKDEDTQENTGGDEPNRDEPVQETSDDKESHQVKHLNAVIYWAILNNQEDLIELAMKKGWDPTLTEEGTRKGVTWLLVAALAGHVNLLGKIPDWRDDIMAEATKKITPLHLAVKQGNFDMVKELLRCLASENPSNQESPSTGWQRVLQAIVQETEEEETLISLAAARRGGQVHGRLERFLCGILHQISEIDVKFFEWPHSLHAELVMGIAAWRHTTGEKEHFDKFMCLAQRGKNCKHPHHSPLGLVVCSQFPEALWWLLSSDSYSGEKHIREGETMMKSWERQFDTKDPVHELIEELLENPPPVRPPLKDDGRPPRFQVERPNSDPQKGTVLSISATDKSEVILKMKRASMVDIIYDKGPDEIMRNDGYSNFQAFRSRLSLLKQPSENQHFNHDGRLGGSSRKAIDEMPFDLLSRWRRVQNKKRSGKGEISEPVSRERQSRFRWFHIPVNNLRYVEELMVRISIEKNRDNGNHRHLADFVQKSWSELPAGGRNHYMKPHFQSYITEQGTSKGSDTMNIKSDLPTGYNRVFALYMPYIFWGQGLSKNNIKDTNERKSISNKNQQETQNALLQRIASSKKIAGDGGAKPRPVSTAQRGQEIKAPGVYLNPFDALIHETGSSAALTNTTDGRVEQETSKGDEMSSTNDIHASTKKPVHKSITLDQYYYVSLQNTESRDRDQVLVRYFKRLRENEKLADEKKQRARKEERPRKTQKAAENSLQIHDHQQDTQGGDSASTETTAKVKSTQILMINQLWLWILDSDTIISSTTKEPDGITNTFLQRVLINLQARNGNTISSIEDIVEYIIATATSLFNAQDIEIDHSDDGKRSPLDIFRETIQYVRDQETKLFREFRISLDSAKQEKSSSNDKNASETYSEADVQKQDDPQTPKEPQKWWGQLAPENPYEDISTETELLDEVKDILDELNILKTLAQDQKVVDDLWKSISKVQGYRHLTPLETKEDIESMIEDAKSIQSAINTLLDLKQKEATILEAQAMRRQSDAVMVFTVVTIIFLPASFLTSLFALNVTDFPHQDGNLIYRGAWIFPVIFGVSVPVSVIFMTIAFNASKIKSIWRAWTESRNQKPPVQKGKNQTEEETVRQRIMGPGNDGNV